jgi:hypothetical protein
MVEQKQADVLFVTGNGLDIDERACQLEYIHKNHLSGSGAERKTRKEMKGASFDPDSAPLVLNE